MTLKCHDHKIKAEQLIPILMMSLLPFGALNVVVMLLSMQNYYVFLIQNLNWLTKFYQFIMSTIYIAHPQLTLMVSNRLSSERKMLGRMPFHKFKVNGDHGSSLYAKEQLRHSAKHLLTCSTEERKTSFEATQGNGRFLFLGELSLYL